MSRWCEEVVCEGGVGGGVVKVVRWLSALCITNTNGHALPGTTQHPSPITRHPPLILYSRPRVWM